MHMVIELYFLLHGVTNATTISSNIIQSGSDIVEITLVMPIRKEYSSNSIPMTTGWRTGKRLDLAEFASTVRQLTLSDEFQ